jgi:hypothetical protein
MNDWVERSAPAAPQYIDVCLGFAAARHGPDDIVGVRRIDVVVYDNHEAAEIGAGMTL